jgi:CHAT domain-containing protein
LDLALSIAAAKGGIEASPIIQSVIESRGVVLDELGARAQSVSKTDPELVSLNAAVTGARERFANLALRSIMEEPVSRVILDDAREKKEEAERALAERSATARAEQARAAIGLDQVRHALPLNAALISFVRYDRATFPVSGAKTRSRTTPSYIGFVIRSDTASVDVVPLGPASFIDGAVTAWHEQAGGRALVNGTLASEAERTYRTVGARLRQLIWEPVAGRLRGTSKVFIVPDGSLNLISFAALPTGPNHYLLDDGPVIHYLSTERDLVPGDSLPSGHGLLAVGGPAFDERLQTAVPASARRTGCATIGNVHFDDLPGSRSEAADISKIWPSSGVSGDEGVKLLMGGAATKAAVERAVVGRRVVHLATHGFFLQSRCDNLAPQSRGVGALAAQSTSSSVLAENPLVLTGLALAGANRRSANQAGQDDGILAAEEVAGLNMQGTEWAVLSACDTGVGQIKVGEGVFGLRRAFQIAGARTIIMSLWSVEDQSTRVWMHNLYDARFNKQLTTVDAMRDASIRVLQDRRAHHLSTHPFYWGGFVAAGDWR